MAQPEPTSGPTARTAADPASAGNGDALPAREAGGLSAGEAGGSPATGDAGQPDTAAVGPGSRPVTGRGRFVGRTAVVTGGAGGIGRAVCAGFAAEGAAVAVVDVDAKSVADAVDALTGAGGLAEGFVLDVSDATAVADMMRRVHAGLGGPHLLVTLAGGSLGTPRDLDAIAPEHIDLVLDVNVKGTLYCCQAAAPYLRDGGAVVTVTSIGARQPSPVTGVPYAAAKAAIGGLTRRLARELGATGIRVNAVAPGLFLTGRLQGMFDAMDPAEQREVLDAIPLGRMPEIREIVDPVLFLASDESSYITGVTLDVNGGRYMPA